MFSCAEISDGQHMGCGGDQMRGWHIKIAVAVLGLTLRHYVAEFHVESNTNNIENIQAQLNKLTVTSVYKPPNEQFSFGSNLASTQMNVVIGDFNSHGLEWGYRSTDENGRLVEQWSETNQLSLVHDAKQPKSFNSKRLQQGYNPDLAFVSYSIAHLAEKDVMDAIPKTQHRPISI